MPVKPGRNTKNEILQLVKMRGRAAIREISQTLAITPMAVRRHVRQLQKAGLLHTEKTKQGRGRPADSCLLTELGDGLFPRAYDRFSAELIASLASLDGEEKVNQLFEARQRQLVEKFADRTAGKSREARVQEAAAILCEEGYMAEYSKLSARRFLITEHNCAIAHIAQKCSQACQSELCFLAQLLHAEVQRQEHVLKGDSTCSYLVEFPAKTAAATPSR